jgi:hypothetical protein
MNQLEPNDLLLFARVVDEGSFSRAGERLGLPKSKLSRRVAELEERLGVRLLQRTTRKLSLTEAGELYRALGHAADLGVMPSFRSAGARAAYALDKLGGRAGRVAGVLIEADECFSQCPEGLLGGTSWGLFFAVENLPFSGRFFGM